MADLVTAPELESNADDSVSLDNLYPALVECFVIIICGYVAGRLQLVSGNKHHALNTFVGTFSLPSFIFIKLATLKLSSLNWLFLLSIFLSKAIVFVFVAIVTLLVTRPVDFASAGLYAIFCTQSNDFAIGYPIISVLYAKMHSEYINYLYLAAPINLVLLNPFGFILMEIGRNRALARRPSHMNVLERSCFSIIKSIVWNILTNPIFVMTGLGLAGNFVFDSEVPPVLATLLNVFAAAFPATALFLLGLRMVGKVQRLVGTRIFVVGILISTKLLALPILIREVTSSIMHGYNMNSTDIASFSTFGFLYGTIPAAPATFVYALFYNVNADLIASAMVACTFISAPLMFSSARMILASGVELEKAQLILKSFELDFSIVGVILAIWTIVVFIVDKTYKNTFLKTILHILAAWVLICLSSIIGLLPGTISTYVQFMFCKVGVLGGCLWVSVLAASLLFSESQNMKLFTDLQPVFVLICWGVPTFSVTLLLILVTPSETTSDIIEIFKYGSGEAVLTIAVVVISFLVTSACLILRRFYGRLHRSNSETSALFLGRESSITQCADVDSIHVNGRGRKDSTRSYQDNRSEPFSDSVSSYTTPIYVVLFFSLCWMFINIAVFMWSVLMDTETGVFIELVFMKVILGKGQILLIFFMFGLDTCSLIHKLFERVKSIWPRIRTIQPSVRWEDLPPETQLTCEQFQSEHMMRCHNDIVINYWWVSKSYRDCFTGRDLVTWLVDHNLAESREDGVHYANELLKGSVLKQLNNSELFYDDDGILYSFSRVRSHCGADDIGSSRQSPTLQ